MPTISGVSFDVLFDLTSTPVLSLTDTTVDPPEDMVGIFTITQPDGYAYTGDIDDPDVASSGGSFEYQLRLDSNFALQCGTYHIKFTAAAPGYLSTDFEREFYFTYQAPVVKLREEFDVFTPRLEYFDDTDYEVDGWQRTGEVIEYWEWSSEPGGSDDISRTDFYEEGIQNLSLEITPAYDAYYEITKTTSHSYVHETDEWLSISETVSETVNTYAETPASIVELVSLLSDLRDEMDGVSCDADREENSFAYAQSLFDHIINKIRTDQTEGIFVDLKELLRVLHGYSVPEYVPTNEIIPPYDLSDFDFSLPSQSGADKKVLTSDGSFASWQWARVTKIFDFIVGPGSNMEDGDTVMGSMMITDGEPMVFDDGILLTWVPSSDRRYASIDIPNTITINGGVTNGENVQVYL